MTDCRNAEMRDRLPLLAAGRLDGAPAAALAAHLAQCEECRAELALLERVRAVTSRAPEVHTARIVAAVRGAPRARRAAPTATRATSWRRWRVAAAAAAAAVLAMLAYEGRDPAGSGAPAGPEAPRSVASNDSIVVAGTELSFGGGLSDLSADELSQLVASLDDFEALPSAEPNPIAPDFSLELEDTL